MHRSLAVLLGVSLALGSCAREPRSRSGSPPDSAASVAIARDRPERSVVPLAGAGRFTLERTALERSALDRTPPVAIAPGPMLRMDTPPAPEPPLPDPSETAGPGLSPNAPALAAPESGRADLMSLKPPIPRGAAVAPSGGGGGRVTLDVRVDEQGDVSDALLVSSDADSLTIRAATEAALAIRYHPALLGGRPVAVWTRQVIDVLRKRR